MFVESVAQIAPTTNLATTFGKKIYTLTIGETLISKLSVTSVSILTISSKKENNMSDYLFTISVLDDDSYIVTSYDNALAAITEYNKYVDPLVYGRYVQQEIGGEKTYYSLGKPFSSNIWHKDFWFFKAKDVMEKEYQTWVAGLKMVSTKITSDHFNTQSFDDQQQLATFLKKYNLVLHHKYFIFLLQSLMSSVNLS